MKKGIDVYSDRDARGIWILRIEKKRGKFTLEEITDICREYEEDFYMLVVNAYSDTLGQYYTEDLEGDFVTLYSANKFFEWRQKN